MNTLLFPFTKYTAEMNPKTDRYTRFINFSRIIMSFPVSLFLLCKCKVYLETFKKSGIEKQSNTNYATQIMIVFWIKSLTYN